MFKPKFTSSSASFSSGFTNKEKTLEPSFDSIVTLKGEDGFSPIIDVEQDEGGYTLTITDKENTEVIRLKNGEIGPIGPIGPEGPIGPIGPEGPIGPAPKRGEDYWTEADKREIINETIALLPIGELEEADKVINERIDGLEEKIEENNKAPTWYMQDAMPDDAPVGALWFCTSDSITYAEEEKY